MVFTDDDADIENMFRRGMPWLADDFGLKDASSSMFPGLSLVQWMNMQQNNNNQFSANQLSNTISSNANLGVDDHSKLLSFQSPGLPAQNLQSIRGHHHQNNQISQLPQSNVSWPHQQQPQSRHQLPLHQSQPQILQQTQPMPLPPITSGNITSDQIANRNLQQMGVYSQLHQQQQISSGNARSVPNDLLANRATFPVPSTAQQHTEQASNFLQRAEEQQMQFPHASLQQNLSQRSIVQQTSSLSDQQMQLQILQKLHQQQQQQLPSPLNSFMESQLPQKQMNGFSSSTFVQSPQFPTNQFQSLQKNPLSIVRENSGLLDTNATSCSTSPSRSNLQVVSQPNFAKNSTGPSALVDNSTFVHPPNLVQDSSHSHSKLDVRIKHELANPNVLEQQPKHKTTATDHMDATSSATSYCLDAGGLQQNFPMAGFDGDVQSHTRNSLPFGAGIDGLAPDALLSKGYDSGKDIQNLLDTDLSSGINSQSFVVPTMSFKPGCSNDGTNINDNGVMNGGMWSNQTQRMRTYTKVQKRGSVGRTIDVTRYKGYDELRTDLARMFGIEGLLEDPQRTEWKLVYLDHENDILLVGDDPWE